MISFTSKIADVTITDNVVHVTLKEGVNIEKADLVSINKLIFEKISNTKYISMIELGNINLGHISKEAFSYQADNEYEQYSIADVFIVKSLGLKLLASFYLATFKPKVPTKVFTNYEDGLAWAKTIEKKALVVR
ncbi:MAG: hypothetical protein J0M08_01960 [Bacteroidetes bacterium]|nr:hypothetical protein [Bacteroidota bacterium]